MKYQLALLSIVVGVMGCKVPVSHNLPPAERLMHPGPGVDGPGPGIMMPPGGAMVALPFPGATSQIAFVGPDGMMVSWDVGGLGMFDSEPLVCPGRYNFPQGAIYRLKVTNIPGRNGVELYPTLEVGPVQARTQAYLAHNAIPFVLTDEDFDQVLSGNFVTKVIYLPDAENQELALAGVETLVSTRLDPGVDPIVEAARLGSILAIIRLGNKDLQVPGMDQGMIGGGGMGGDISLAGCDSGMLGPGGMVGPGGVPPQFVAGMTAPEYGMPITGTPIGLPGPPHIPLGGPAGLQKHVIRNHTFVHMPQPVEKVKIHVKQAPGMTYPKPASRAFITERAFSPPRFFHQPFWSKHQHVGSDHEPCGDPNCVDCAECAE